MSRPGAITSGGPPYDYFMSLMPQNPHVRFFESRVCGYTICDVNEDRWQTDYIAVDRSLQNPAERTLLASYAVQAGQPGPVAL